MTIYRQTANPNATNSELDAKIIIKYDETNQPEDWEDFWHSPEKYGTWDTTNDEKGDDIVVNMDGGVGGSWQVKDDEEIVEIPPYVEAILGLTDYPADCKRESPLSE